MPAESTTEELTPLLARIGLAEYTQLLVEDEELTTDLLKTMERSVATESLLELGMANSAATKLCDALFGGSSNDDDDDDDGLALETNHAEDDDDDALELEDNSTAAPISATAPKPAAPKPAPAAAAPKQDLLVSRYNKWDAFEDSDEDEDPTMQGAVREHGQYEVLERMVYCMHAPNTQSGILEVKTKGDKVRFYCHRTPAPPTRTHPLECSSVLT